MSPSQSFVANFPEKPLFRESYMPSVKKKKVSRNNTFADYEKLKEG